MTPPPRPAFDLSDRYVSDHAALDPVDATFSGISGFDDRLTDQSPDGIAARLELDRRTLAEVEALETGDDADRVAAAFLAERLRSGIAWVEMGEPFRQLCNIAGPVVDIRQVFDMADTDSVDGWRDALGRLREVPAALAGFEATLQEGLDRGMPAARRQVEEAARQASVFAGESSAPPWFTTWATTYDAHDTELGAALVEAAPAADAAYAGIARWLRERYAPHATDRDGVGAERYAVAVPFFLGAVRDPLDMYEWGWEEVQRLVDDMGATAGAVLPGQPLAAVVQHLQTDPTRALASEEEVVVWLQEIIDRRIAELDGVHFDIAPELRTCTAKLAPEGSAAAAYYTPPTEDFSRPGHTWFPKIPGRTHIPLWGEMSTCHHESVPGHHLQCGQAVLQKEQLSRSQRIGFISGHGEGWALYAERLMDELGALDDPAYRLGMLREQLFRAARVVVDIGLHLDLRIPAGTPLADGRFAGERWTPVVAEHFLMAVCHESSSTVQSEVLRYLGLPAQAISYKVGERVWLELRSDVAARLGAGFDLKQFHMAALNLGPLGLDVLRDEVHRALVP